MAQTEKTKTLGWHTAAAVLHRQGVPRQFTTTSRVALVGNDWKSLNADVAALEDRGHVLVFEPTALAGFRRVRAASFRGLDSTGSAFHTRSSRVTSS